MTANTCVNSGKQIFGERKQNILCQPVSDRNPRTQQRCSCKSAGFAEAVVLAMTWNMVAHRSRKTLCLQRC